MKRASTLTTTAAALTVSENSGATAINIVAPSDPRYPASKLLVTITGLPTDGMVLLSDGLTPVWDGETISAAQLSGLTFKPTAWLFGQTSTFTYTVTDPSGATATGIATLSVAPDALPPTTTAATLTVAANAAPTPIGIVAPADPNYAATLLQITVTALPNDGSVLLSDGVTPVSSGERLSVAQLTGLQFKPTSNLSSASSSFTYTVTDPSGLSAVGTAALAIVAAPGGTPARTAAAFLGSLGVNTHLGNWTVYENVSIVQASLAYLGINNIRDGMNAASNAQTEYSQVASGGTKFDFLVNNGTDIPTFQSELDAFATAHPASLAAIEGPNEVDQQPYYYNGVWSVSADAQAQKALYLAVKSDPLLAVLPVFNMTIVNPTNYAAAGDLSSAADDANVHAYVWDGTAPNGALLNYIDRSHLDAPGLPTVFTEAGYDTVTSDTMSGVNEAVQAKYTLSTLMDAFNAGVARTYLYELLDEGTSPTDIQSNFGLFHNDGSPKLAATAIHNLTQVLADPGSWSGLQPGSLNYTISGLPADGYSMLLQKSDGTFDLVLWAEPLLWNPNTQQPLAAPTSQVGVNFGQTFKSADVYDPMAGTSPIAASANAQSVQIVLTDHPIIIGLTA